jgi:hypothetical protein
LLAGLGFLMVSFLAMAAACPPTVDMVAALEAHISRPSGMTLN